MSDAFDASVDTSVDDTGADYSASGGLDGNMDTGSSMEGVCDAPDALGDTDEVGGLMDDPSAWSDLPSQTADTGDIAFGAPGVDSIMDHASGVDAIMDAHADIEGPYTGTGDVPTEGTNIRDVMDAAGDVESDLLAAGPDIPTLRGDETADSLEDVMSAEAETGDIKPDTGDEAMPSPDVPILQGDETADSLEAVMSAEAETGDMKPDTGDEAVSSPDVPILQGDETADSLETVMSAEAETGDMEPDTGDEAVSSPDVPILQGDGTEGPLEEMAGERNGDTRIYEDMQADELMQEGTAPGPDITGGETAEAADAAAPDVEPIRMSQSDVEWYIENADDAESLRQMRNGIASGRIQIDADTEIPADHAAEGTSGPVLARDPGEQWEIGTSAIDNMVEAMRDDLRDKGMEDGAEMEAIVMEERARMQDELARNIAGDFSAPYQMPDFAEPVEETATDVPIQGPADMERQADGPETAENVSDVAENIDYDAIYAGLDRYNFDGIDVNTDVERLDTALDQFQSETWESMSVDEQKAAMSDLADYVEDIIGFDNPPEIVYYNNPVDGDYGGYSRDTNTLSVNEYMLYNNSEAADTIAHELWHAYQCERAANPQSAKDYQYQYGFDNYIKPEDDFSGYQEQLVEAEARAFAQQFKDRLSTKRRRI